MKMCILNNTGLCALFLILPRFISGDDARETCHLTKEERYKVVENKFQIYD